MNNIKKLRAMSGMSQNELAEAIGVTCGAVSLWETGDRKPRPEKAYLLARLFGVAMEDIYERSDA